MKFQKAYDAKPRVKTVNNEPTMTKQNLADNADVNKIIRKYAETGTLQKATDFEGIYGDFDSTDFAQAMNTVADANSLFEKVPSQIRAQYKNDPGAFIDFATDPGNNQQMVEWGMATLTTTPEIPEIPEIPETPETPPITEKEITEQLPT